MKRSRTRTGIGWLMLLLVLSSCSLLVAPEREFSSVMRDYTMRLRWMDFNGVARHFEPELREGFLQRFGGVEDLHVVDVNLDSLDFPDGDRRAETTLILDYYILPSATVERLRLRQAWTYQEVDRYNSGVWQIVTPFPEFP